MAWGTGRAEKKMPEIPLQFSDLSSLQGLGVNISFWFCLGGWFGGALLLHPRLVPMLISSPSYQTRKNCKQST